jgi:hypothetical protein
MIVSHGEAIVVASSLTIVASDGPFGPTVGSCLFLLAMILLPFFLLALAARSLLSAEPLSGWLVGLLLVGAIGLAYLLWPADIGRGVRGIWRAWQVASIGSLVLLPAVFLREGGKRDLIGRVFYRKKRHGKRSRPAE